MLGYRREGQIIKRAGERQGESKCTAANTEKKCLSLSDLVFGACG